MENYMRMIALSLVIFLNIACLPENSSQILSESKQTDLNNQQTIEEMVQDFENKEIVPTLNVADLRQQIIESPQDYILVDVREPFEREISVIEKSITKEQLEKDLESNNSIYRHKKIVSYCTIGYRSMYYTKELKDMGLDAYNLRGSILSWLHEGENVVLPSTNKATLEVHVYGAKWKLAPSQYKMHVKSSWYSSMFGN